MLSYGNVKTAVFADDTMFYIAGKCVKDSKINLQRLATLPHRDSVNGNYR
jgi:hypothetical protein